MNVKYSIITSFRNDGAFRTFEGVGLNMLLKGLERYVQEMDEIKTYYDDNKHYLEVEITGGSEKEHEHFKKGIKNLCKVHNKIFRNTESVVTFA